MAKKTGTDKADTLIGTARADELMGLGGKDVLRGEAGDDRLDGGAGDDDLRGGLGNDIYIVDNVGDIDKKLIDPGNDFVGAFITYTLGPQQEHLTLLGKAALNGIGNALGNRLTGNDGVNVLSGLDGNDSLDGLKGVDDLRGGRGNDLYFIDDAREINRAFTDAGKDQVHSIVNYTLGIHQEDLILTGKAAVIGTGNNGANFVRGNDIANTLHGLGGNDTLEGLKGNDKLFGDAGNDKLFGGAGDDELNGGAGADILDGGLGNDVLLGGLGFDTLRGGDGHDIYVLDGALGDSAAEIAGGEDHGTDTVWANFDFALELNAAQENITLYGNFGRRAEGNEGNNALTGTDADGDVLLGLGGDDLLDGGAGLDHLSGDDGNDRYVIDHADEIDPLVDDLGRDTVFSRISYTLLAQQENLTLLGNLAAQNATGNGAGNLITGNSADNVLHGLGGDDEIKGGVFGSTGHDSLFGDAGSDFLHYSPDAVVIDGGADIDALFVLGTGAQVTLDLTLVDDGKIKDIEAVVFASNDVAVGQAHDLIMGRDDILALSSTLDIVKVIGEADDSVHLTGPGTWIKNAVSVESGFQDYSNGGATVRIDTHILESHVFFT